MKKQKSEMLKKIVEDKYIVGIDPGDYNHRAAIIDQKGSIIGKPFGFAVNYDGFNNTFINRIKQLIPDYMPDKITIAIETSIDFYQTFTEFAKKKGFTVVNVSPLKTYLARGLDNNDFSKSDNKDARLVAENAFKCNFLKSENYSEEFKALHSMSIQYDKLLKDKCSHRLQLRSFMHRVFPEYLTVFDIETQTSLYLLTKYFTPEDFINLDIEKEAAAISKISISQHGVKTLKKLKELAGKTIGVSVSEFEKASQRIILNSHIESLNCVKKYMEEIINEMIKSAEKSKFFTKLVSIKGISKILAAQFIAECPQIENFKHFRQLEKYIGYNLRFAQSGIYAGARHINKLGNKRLARIVFQMVEQTSRYVPEVRIKYLRRKLKCKTYKKNIIAASSELLKLLISLFNSDNIYSDNYSLDNEIAELEKKIAVKNKINKRA